MADKEFLSPVTLAVLKLKNAANTFTNLFSNETTAARTWTLPDKSGTVALSSDLTDLAQLLNPVGTIREFNVSTNPNTILGFGTWESFGTGRVTVAIDSNQTEFNTINKTGGAKTHTHNVNITSNQSTPMFAVQGGATYAVSPNTHTHTVLGSTAESSSLMPYIVVYRWVRTA